MTTRHPAITRSLIFSRREILELLACQRRSLADFEVETERLQRTIAINAESLAAHNTELGLEIDDEKFESTQCERPIAACVDAGEHHPPCRCDLHMSHEGPCKSSEDRRGSHRHR